MILITSASMTAHYQQVEQFSLMAAIIFTRFPHKALELLAYQAVIVHTKGTMKALNRYLMTIATSRKPWCGRISIGQCQMCNTG